MQLDKAIKQRHSVRKFKKKKPDWRDIIEAIDFTRYAPMAGNNFSLKFILVSDKEKIEKIAEAAQQDFIKQVDYLVVACTNPKRTKNAYGKRGERYLKQQAGAGIQNFLLAIEDKGLSTCWVGHFVDEQIKKILDVPKDIDIEAIFPIGYEYKKPKTRKAKIELDRILYFDKYKNKKMKKIKTLNI